MGQQRQHGPFAAAQLDGFASDGGAAVVAVQHHAAHLQAAAARQGAAHQGMQPRFQFRKVERLGHVVVGAGLQAAYAVLQAVAGGEHDDGQQRLLGAHLAQQAQAVQQRQAQVEDGEVEAVAAQQVFGNRAVGRVLHREAGARQLRGQPVGQQGIVFGKQDVHAPRLTKRGDFGLGFNLRLIN